MEITLENAKKQRIVKNLPLNMRVTGWLSPYLIYIFSMLGISPNIITFSWILLAFYGIYLIAQGTYSLMLLGILIYHLALLLDSADGGVARLLNKANAGGEFLDRFFSTINRSLLLLAIGIGLFSRYNNETYLYLGIFSSILVFSENLVKMKRYEALINSNRFDLIQEHTKQHKKMKHGLVFYIYEAFRPGNHFTLSFFCILFNIASIYLIVFSILIFFQLIFTFAKEFKILKHIQQKH